MQEVQMFDHGELVELPGGETGTVLYPTTSPPVEFFDPIEGPFILRAVFVLVESGEVRRYIASALTPLIPH
ncbi:hypothetical protein [Microbacterium sp. SS28]|uniref:hypothetical protein n=1 Tax=Microbacterium sp. SS28 TaxID=2919948 RepID=UPI001FA99A53|nr:hypothetical protein [Microbacterium sp. SS28]